MNEFLCTLLWDEKGKSLNVPRQCRCYYIISNADDINERGYCFYEKTCRFKIKIN